MTGPGEFRELGNVAPWPGDSLVAWFAPGWRISVFDGDGNYGRTFGINDGTRPWRFRPDSPTRDGLFLAVLAPEDADTVVLELRDHEGGLRSSLGTHPGSEPHLMHEGTDRETLYWKIFGREPAWAVWGDLVAVGVSSRYEFKAYRADGSLARIIRREHDPREVTAADVDAHTEGRRFRTEAGRREYLAVPVSDHFPAFIPGSKPSRAQKNGACDVSWAVLGRLHNPRAPKNGARRGPDTKRARAPSLPAASHGALPQGGKRPLARTPR